MSSHSSKNKFAKREKSKEWNKKFDNSKIEALMVTIEKKKKCISKALEIVTNFSEGSVTEKCLLESLQFINQEYYQDITEERSINKLCGYPVCGNMLKHVPLQQFHISTTHNKVFDITDRKNFCSNLCYKASKYLKDQILTSPLWLRDEQASSGYHLISLDSRGGISGAGDEVDLGYLKLSGDQCLSEPDTNKEAILSEQVCSKSETQEIHLGCLDVLNLDQVSDHLHENHFLAGSLETVVATTKKSSDCAETDISELNLIQLNIDNDKNVNVREAVLDTTITDSHMPISTVKLVVSDASNFTSDTGKERAENIINVDISKFPNENIILKTISSNTQKTKKRTCKETSKKKQFTDPNHPSPAQTVVMKIENVLKEWFSIDSLCYLYGEGKVKDMLAEHKNYLKNKQVSSMSDPFVYERYLAICQKLNVMELEDTKEDASFRDEVRRPLPDYQALREEAKNLDLKVKMFYQGDKVQFEQPVEGTNIKEGEQSMTEPVLPLVDLHAQKALRRRIVLDRLKRVLQDLQEMIGLRGFSLSEEVRPLVSSLTLSAHNITMRPPEWNLVGIIVIKLLSLKDVSLGHALASPSINKHLTLLLMSYSLDTGYLDRLVSWLTDVEGILKKTS